MENFPREFYAVRGHYLCTMKPRTPPSEGKFYTGQEC